jgi:hypothetical protein
MFAIEGIGIIREAENAEIALPWPFLFHIPLYKQTRPP